MRILYIEDNDDNIYMLKNRLERKGYEVVVARDGLEGYTMATTCEPAIILMDVGLPVLDGYQAVGKIKSDPRINHIPIIMLTAHALSEDRERAIKAGANDYEPKPINFQALLTKIVALTPDP